MRSTTVGAALLGLAVLAPHVSAQPGTRLALVGTIEYVRITEDDGFLGAGPGTAGGVQLDLTNSTSLAVEVGLERHVRDLDVFATAFDEQGVVSGGLGVMAHGGTLRGPLALPQIPSGYTLQPQEFEARRGRRATAVTVDGAFGADIHLTERLTVRPFVALRLANTDNVGPKYLFRSGGRVAVRW